MTFFRSQVQYKSTLRYATVQIPPQSLWQGFRDNPRPGHSYYKAALCFKYQFVSHISFDFFSTVTPIRKACREPTIPKTVRDLATRLTTDGMTSALPGQEEHYDSGDIQNTLDFVRSWCQGQAVWQGNERPRSW